MLPKAKLLFKLQQGLSFQGWQDPQDGLTSGFKASRVSHRHPLSYFLPFVLTSSVSVQF